MDLFTAVKNLNGTSDNQRTDGKSWKKYWEEKTGKSFSECSNTRCSNDAIVGGHVKKADGSKNWFIVPLCHTCNHIDSTESFLVPTKNMVPVTE